MTRKIPPPLPSVFALGLVCQIAQILFLREFLMVFHGNELSIGIILAAWMFWVAMGSRWGSVRVDRLTRPVTVLLGVTLGVLVFLPITLIAIRGLRGFFDVLPGAYLSLLDMLYSCLFVMAPVCLLLGFQFVLLARIWREYDRRTDTTAAGKTYMIEAAGNILGGILFTFLLVHYAGAFHVALMAVLVMVAALGWTRKGAPATPDQRPLSPFRLLYGGILVTCFAVLPFLHHLDAWAYRMQWNHFAPDYAFIETRLSKYGNIAVAQREDQYSFFQSGHLVFSAAGPEAESAALEDVEGAIFAHFALSQHPRPKRVLLIGGGMRGTLREIARHPVERIDYVELDEVLIETARQYISQETLAVLDSERVRLKHVDGRLYVKSTDETYDMIIVDVPDPATAVLNRYYTKEFYREASERLRSGGVLVTSAMSVADLRGSAAVNRNATIYHTLKVVFPHVLPVGERTLFFFASHDAEQILSDPDALRARYLERNIATDSFSPRQFDMLLEEGPLRRVNWILRHHGRRPRDHLETPNTGPLFPGSIAEQEAEEMTWPPVQPRTFINSDFRPIAYYYTLVFWNVLARVEHVEAFRWMVRVQAWWIAPVVGLALLFALILRGMRGAFARRAGLRYGVRFAVFTTGLSTMALQMALLFSFQNIYGFVYEMIGLIVAMFMAGLLSGTYMAQRWIRNKSNIRLLAAVQLGIAVFAGGIALLLPVVAALTSPVTVFLLFSMITFVAGLLNGVDFPLATACCMVATLRADRATGVVYGVELFGACLGSVLAGAVVAPVLGIVACCWLACIANATAFGILMTARSADGATDGRTK